MLDITSRGLERARLFRAMPSALNVGRCRLLELPLVEEQRGNLTFIEGERHAPFRIERVYYISGVPPERTRGGHAHREIEEVIVCVAGSFHLIVDDGRRRQRITMDHADRGMYIPPFVWHELESFSADAVALGLASLPYNEEDHFRDYDEFVRVARELSA